MGRRKFDAYYTHEVMIKRLDRLYSLRGLKTILEPCVGDGAVVKTVKELYPGTEFITNDINRLVVADTYLNAARFDCPFWHKPNIDAMITNPPFNVALDIMHNWWKSPIQVVCVLARLSFQEPTGDRTGNRGDFLETVSDHIVKVGIFGNPRPSFTRRGSDNVTTHWLVIDKEFSWLRLGIESPFNYIQRWKL